MSRHRKTSSVLQTATLAILAACGPRATTDLEILSVAVAAGSTPVVGSTVALEAQVRNNGRDAATVAAAVGGSPEMGLLRRGPEREIRRGRTQVLTLEVPAERTFLRGCEFVALVFLVRPGDPPNIARDLWLDPVPENNSREVRAALPRPLPTALRVTEPIVEVVESSEGDVLRHHYEADVAIVPEGSSWAAADWAIQTQTSSGEPVQILGARVDGGRLRSQSVVWTGGAARRQSVARATIQLEYRNCEGETAYLLGERFAVRLASR